MRAPASPRTALLSSALWGRRGQGPARVGRRRVSRSLTASKHREAGARRARPLCRALTATVVGVGLLVLSMPPPSVGAVPSARVLDRSRHGEFPPRAPGAAAALSMRGGEPVGVSWRCRAVEGGRAGGLPGQRCAAAGSRRVASCTRKPGTPASARRRCGQCATSPTTLWIPRRLVFACWPWHASIRGAWRDGTAAERARREAQPRATHGPASCVRATDGISPSPQCGTGWSRVLSRVGRRRAGRSLYGGQAGHSGVRDARCTACVTASLTAPVAGAGVFV